MKLVLWLALTLTVFAAACEVDPAAFQAAVSTGVEEVAPAAPYVPGALAGQPVSLIAISSYILNAILGAWGTYERRKRKKVENA